MWQSDMSNAFYLFRIPSAWQPYLAFNVIREGNEVNGLSQNTRFCLACRVLPMGWSSSVGVMQEVSENILWHFGLGRDNQIMRRKAVPLWMVGILEKAKDLGQAWWHVYLDNFAVGEISQRGQTMDGTKLHNMAEAAWEHSGVISSGKKRKTGVLTAEELGAAFDGKERTMGGHGVSVAEVDSGNAMAHRQTTYVKAVDSNSGRTMGTCLSIQKTCHVLLVRGMEMCLITWTWGGDTTESEARVADVPVSGASAAHFFRGYSGEGDHGIRCLLYWGGSWNCSGAHTCGDQLCGSLLELCGACRNTSPCDQPLQRHRRGI